MKNACLINKCMFTVRMCMIAESEGMLPNIHKGSVNGTAERKPRKKQIWIELCYILTSSEELIFVPVNPGTVDRPMKKDNNVNKYTVHVWIGKCTVLSWHTRKSLDSNGHLEHVTLAYSKWPDSIFYKVFQFISQTSTLMHWYLYQCWTTFIITITSSQLCNKCKEIFIFSLQFSTV